MIYTFIKVSRTVLYGFLLQLMCFVLVLAKEGNAQNKHKSVEHIYLTVRFKQSKLTQTFEQIGSQTKFNFIYQNNLLEQRSNVSLHLKNKSLGDLLRLISKKSNLQFRRINENILVKEREHDHPQVSEVFEKLEVTITGKITDENGEGLPGAFVRVKGSSPPIGATTNIDGNFKLNVPKNAVLMVSFVGYKTQEITVGNRTVINVQLQTDAKQLEDVVVTGYQTIDRKLFTGSAETLKMKDIEQGGMPNVATMLEGQAAGVIVDNVSGTFGAAPKIRIRGNVSVRGDNQPLWVVDGVVFESLNPTTLEEFVTGNTNSLVSSSIPGLNPDDIKSLDVLRDVSATAIYGARAANGVIVITTKRGEKGSLRVSYTGNYSMNLRPSYRQFFLLNSAEEMSVYRELLDKGHVNAFTVPGQSRYGVLGKMFYLIHNRKLDWGAEGNYLNEDFINPYENANTDWFDVLFKDLSLQQQHAVNFSSGTNKVRNYFSINYLSDDGQTIADWAKRVTGTARTTFYVSERFNFGLKLNTVYRKQRISPGNSDTPRHLGTINPYSYALSTARSIRPYDQNGKLEYFRKNYADFNILEETQYNFVDISVHDLSLQSDFHASPLKGLTLNMVVSGRYAFTQTDHTVHEKSNQARAYRVIDPLIEASNSPNPYLARNTKFFSNTNTSEKVPLKDRVVLPRGGQNYVRRTELINLFGRATIEYTKAFDVHQINAIIGQEVRYTDRNSQSSRQLGVIYQAKKKVETDPRLFAVQNELDAKTNRYDAADPYSVRRERFWGSFLTLGYNYGLRYVVNLTLRTDASNLLGEGTNVRFLPTWNVSGAWNLDEELFIKDRTAWLQTLKLRGAYGVTANIPPGSNAGVALTPNVVSRPDHFAKKALGLYVSAPRNESLDWERLTELNVGLSFGLLDNRLRGSADYYRREGLGLIGAVNTGGLGGAYRKNGNHSSLRSHGYEVTLHTVNYQKGDFQWTTDFNLGYTKDEITQLVINPELKQVLERRIGTPLLGGPKAGFYSIRFAGLNNRGVPHFYDMGKQTLEPSTEPNDPTSTTYLFHTGGRHNLQSILTLEGSAEPRAAGGLTNTFRYKGLSLRVLISAKFDYKVRLRSPDYRSYSLGGTALPGEVKNRWVEPGDERQTNIPAILSEGFGRRSVGGGNNGGRNAAGFAHDYNSAYAFYPYSTVRTANGNYARLKSVRLAYDFPSKLLRKFKLSSLRLAVEGQNLMLLYADKKLRGQDPEFVESGGTALPQPRLITFSLNLGL